MRLGGHTPTLRASSVRRRFETSLTGGTSTQESGEPPQRRASPAALTHARISSAARTGPPPPPRPRTAPTSSPASPLRPHRTYAGAAPYAPLGSAGRCRLRALRNCLPWFVERRRLHRRRRAGANAARHRRDLIFHRRCSCLTLATAPCSLLSGLEVSPSYLNVHAASAIPVYTPRLRVYLTAVEQYS